MGISNRALDHEGFKIDHIHPHKSDAVFVGHSPALSVATDVTPQNATFHLGISVSILKFIEKCNTGIIFLVTLK